MEEARRDHGSNSTASDQRAELPAEVAVAGEGEGSTRQHHTTTSQSKVGVAQALRRINKRWPATMKRLAE